MPEADIPIQGFVHEDSEGPYLRCASFVDGAFCEGKQRPQDAAADGSRRWVCPNCGSSTRQHSDRSALADGGTHSAIEGLSEAATEAERVEAAVEAALTCVHEGDSVHNAAEWAIDKCDLDESWIPDVRERVFGALAADQPEVSAGE